MKEALPHIFLKAGEISEPKTKIILFIIGLIVAGFILLAIELFLIPGFGITGILSILMLIGGCILAWMKFGTYGGTTVVILTISVLGVVFTVASKMGLWKKMVLQEDEKRWRGTESSGLEHLLNKEGITMTPLRPSGIAEFGDERVDVVTDGVFISKGTRVKVILIEGPRVVVEPLKKEKGGKNVEYN
jgi:membrane-bound serine protease (ClpP class)